MARSKCPSCESSSVERVRRWFWMRPLFRKRYRCNCCGSYMYEIVTTLAEQNQRPLSFGLALYSAMRPPLSAIARSFHLRKAAGVTNPILVSVTEVMTRQARHLGRLLKNLRDLARITRDRIVLQVQTRPGESRGPIRVGRIDSVDAGQSGQATSIASAGTTKIRSDSD